MFNASDQLDSHEDRVESKNIEGQGYHEEKRKDPSESRTPPLSPEEVVLRILMVLSDFRFTVIFSFIIL